jgi:hypothetical protein
LEGLPWTTYVPTAAQLPADQHDTDSTFTLGSLAGAFEPVGNTTWDADPHTGTGDDA